MRLALVWWKDLLWHRRRIPFLLALVLMPLVFSGTYSFFNKGDYTPHYQQSAIISHETNGDFPPSYVPPFRIKVFLPATTRTEEIKAFGEFCRELCGGYNVTTAVKGQEDYRREEKDTAFLIVEEWDVRKPSLKYRYVDFQLRITSFLSPRWGLWSLDQKSTDRRETQAYAATTQRLLDAHFYHRRECHLYGLNCSTKPANSSRKGYSLLDTVVRHSAQPLFNPSTASSLVTLGQMTTFFSLLVVWQTAEQMAEERRAGGFQLLTGLGIGPHGLFGTYWVVAYVKLLVMMVVLWITPFILLENAYEVTVIVPALLLYAGVLASFAVLCATVFHGKWAARLGSTAILLFLHLGQFGQEESTHPVLCLLFPQAWYCLLRSSATRRAVGGFVPESGSTPIRALPGLIIPLFLMFGLAIFIDSICPCDGRRRALPWYFMFTPSFWRRGKGQPPLYDSVDAAKTANLKAVKTDDIETAQESSQSGSHMETGRRTEAGGSLPQEDAVCVEGVCKAIDGMWTVNRVTMRAAWNEITILYGPQGAGGKEILELIARRLRPDFGYIDVKSPKESVSLATEPSFLPHLTVEGLVGWMSKARGGPETPEELDQMTDELSLRCVQRRRVDELDSIQKQQLSLLLAFVGAPKIVLLDEPSANCPPGVRNSMHAFIMARKKDRAILISTYDPVEAELGDTVAFLSQGHLVSLGSVGQTRQCYISSAKLIIWPSCNFAPYQRSLIERLIHVSHTGEVKSPPPTTREDTWEVLPNESIRFQLPLEHPKTEQKTMQILERNRAKLGVKHFEIQRQNIQDAYYNCIRSSEQADDTDPKILAMRLERLYTLPKGAAIWPELKTIAQLQINFHRTHWLGNLVSFLTPLVLVLLLSLFAALSPLAEEGGIRIGAQMLERGIHLGQEARIVTNVALRGVGGAALMKMNSAAERKKLLEGRLVYEQPAIVAGVLEEQGLYHLYALQMLRFGDMLAQNLFINAVIDARTHEEVVTMWIQSQETSTAWIKSSGDEQEQDSWLPNLSTRELGSILMRQWTAVMIVGSVLGIMLARSALMVGKLAQDNCMNMHMLLGYRPVLYWLAIFLIDWAAFLLISGLSLLLLYLAAGCSSASLAIAFATSQASFALLVPAVYLLALTLRNPYSAFWASLVLLGGVAVLPACFPFIVGKYGSSLEELAGLSVLLAFSPPLASGLATAVYEDLVGVQERSSAAAFVTIAPLFSVPCFYFWLWILLPVVLCSGRWYSRLKFWWEEMTMETERRVDTDGPDVLIKSLDGGNGQEQSQDSSVSSRPPTTVGTNETVFETSGTRTAGKGASIRPSSKSSAPVDKTPRTAGGKDGEYQTLTGLQSRIRKLPEAAANNPPQQQQQSQMLAPVGTKSRMMVVKPSRGPPSKEPSQVGGGGGGSPMGLWEARDVKGSTTPIVDYNLVKLDHYTDVYHLVNFNIFDLQTVYICGDLPANRTALLDMAAGQSYPRAGQVMVNGSRADCRTRTRMGYVPLDTRLCSFLTTRQTLEMAARHKSYAAGGGATDRDQLVDFLLNLTGLAEVAGWRVSSLTVSDKRMLQFAVAIVERPTVLILDEIDRFLSPTRMKTVWAVAELLREHFSTPIIFTSSRTAEAEAASSHTVMLYQGAVSLAETTAEIKKRFAGLLTLTLRLKKNLTRENVQSVVLAQLPRAESQPHPHPQKLSFLIPIDEAGAAAAAGAKYIDTIGRVRSLMATIGIEDYLLETPNLDDIYHANFTSYVEAF